MKNKGKVLVGLAILIVGTALTHKSYGVHFFDTLGTRYEGAVERLVELGIVSGSSKNVFDPYRTVTRAEFAKMLTESSLRPSEFAAWTSDDAEIRFKDVNKDAWYYKYVVAAVNCGYMKGYEDNSFRPDAEINYNEISKMVTLALGHDYLKPEGENGWATEYVAKMYEIGCFQNTNFPSLEAAATRGNVANIIWNMLKSDVWELTSRNEKNGFTYASTNKTLFSHKVVDHVLLDNVKVNGFEEINGKLYIWVDRTRYKLFDQSAKYYYSQIGGYSDVLLKRVEYPGEVVSLEAIGISTDIGAELYDGTYDELVKDGFDLKNKYEIGSDTDFIFIYHYDNDDSRDRTKELTLRNYYLVEKVDIKDENIKEDKSDDEKEKTHSKVESEFEDDIIGYRYNNNDPAFTRMIEINEGEKIIHGGAVLFKNNVRVDWKELKEDDLLVEVSKDNYYFIMTPTIKEVVLEDYSNKNNDYYITTSNGKYETYANTMLTTYTSNEVKRFNKQKKDVLDNLKGKKVRLTIDMAGRVAKIDIIEGEIEDKDIEYGIYTRFSKKTTEKGDNYVEILQNGKKVLYVTSMEAPSVNKGTLVKYTFDKDKPKVINEMKPITNKTDLSDKIIVDKYKTSKIQDTVKHFDEEDELRIVQIIHHYKFGKYDEEESYEVRDMSIDEFLGINDDNNTETYVVMDVADKILAIYVDDYREKTTTYYGIVRSIVTEKVDKEDYKKPNLIIQVDVVGVKDTQEYKITELEGFEKGDFIKFDSPKKETFNFIERYSRNVMGYYKDLEVISVKKDAKGVQPIAYMMKDGSDWDVADWKLKSEDDEINLNAFEIFLINVSKKDGEYRFDDATRISSQSNVSLQVGDKIAINEIEDTIVIYRGFSG